MKTWRQRLAAVLEWSAVDKGFIPVAMLLPIYAQYLIWGLYTLQRPDRERLVDVAATNLLYMVMLSFIAGTVLIALLGLLLRRRHPHLIFFQYLSALYYAMTLVLAGYFVGTMTFAAGVVLMGGPLFGFIVLNRRLVWVAFLAALVLLVALTYATAFGFLPYAPIIRPPLDAASNLFWMNSYYFFAAPHLFFILILVDQTLSWWRKREDMIGILSRTDVLTGIHNRRSILDLLENECARTHRHGPPMCVVLLDLDHFKKINDSWGHPVGDRVLQQAAAMMRDSIRQYDAVGRYGGEEFMLLLPDTTLAGAESLVERCRENLAAISITSDTGEVFSISASFGLVCNEQCLAVSAETLIKAADDALYRAKEAGRNCVVAVSLPEKKTESTLM